MRIQFTGRQINPLPVIDCEYEEAGKGNRNEKDFNN